MEIEAAIVCLVGLRCSGKTTVGRLLAQRLRWPFTDADQALVDACSERDGPRAEGAGELLIALGEEEFRRREAHVLEELLDAGAPRVIATGGGCIERAATRERLRRVRTLWLDAPVDVLATRLRGDDTLRPSLTGGDPAEELASIAVRRAPLYREVAEATCDATRPPEELAGEIALWIAGER